MRWVYFGEKLEERCIQLANMLGERLVMVGPGGLLVRLYGNVSLCLDLPLSFTNLELDILSLLLFEDCPTFEA